MERKSWVKTSLRARVFGNAAGVTARRHSKITSIRLLQLKLFVLKVVSFNQNDKVLLGCYIKQIMNVFHSCNGANMFIRWKLECSIQLGSASLNRTFHLSTHEHIRTIALINIHYVYTIPCPCLQPQACFVYMPTQPSLTIPQISILRNIVCRVVNFMVDKCCNFLFYEAQNLNDKSCCFFNPFDSKRNYWVD